MGLKINENPDFKIMTVTGMMCFIPDQFCVDLNVQRF